MVFDLLDARNGCGNILCALAVCLAAHAALQHHNALVIDRSLHVLQSRVAGKLLLNLGEDLLIVSRSGTGRRAGLAAGRSAARRAAVS